MPEACPETSPSVHIVQVAVSLTHPLLLLRQELPWEAITVVMTHHWRQHGKNVDGRLVLYRSRFDAYPCLRYSVVNISTKEYDYLCLQKNTMCP